MSDYISDQKYIKRKFENRFFVQNWEAFALRIFEFQYKYNRIYKTYCDLLNSTPEKINKIEQIPFLPIELFKRYPIKTGEWESEVVFKSSGTTDQIRSHHHVRNINFYLDNATYGFEQVYGKSDEFAILGLLPGYSMHGVSSLVQMVNALILKSRFSYSGFYLDRKNDLLEVLGKLKKDRIPTILFGVSFALIDLFDFAIDFPQLVVIETGGMKRSDIELSKEEIISRIRAQWVSSAIHSEYGMTELFSQAYSNDGVWYTGMDSLRVFIGELGDPFVSERPGRTGVIKIIDVANFETCSFIETQDLGIQKRNGQFQVLGRLNNSELRGCNLLLDDNK